MLVKLCFNFLHSQVFMPAKIYTSEDLKWDAPVERHFKSLPESDP